MYQVLIRNQSFSYAIIITQIFLSCIIRKIGYANMTSYLALFDYYSLNLELRYILFHTLFLKKKEIKEREGYSAKILPFLFMFLMNQEQSA